MLQCKLLAVALILLLGSTLTEVGARAISKRHVRRDWLIIPDTIAWYMYESVNKTSPKVAGFFAEAVQTSIILEARNFLIGKTAQIHVQAEQLAKEISRLWQKEKTEPTQQ